MVLITMVSRFVSYKGICFFFLLCMVFVPVYAQKCDTILVSHCVPPQLSTPGYDEEEFFFEFGKRQSAFSCIVAKKGDKVCSIRFSQSNDVKSSLMDVTDILGYSQCTDTSESDAYFPISYSQQIKALEEILKRLSTKSCFSERITFIMWLEDAGEQALFINSSYQDRLSHINKNADVVLKQIIEKSQFYSDISNAFSKASLRIVSMETEKTYSISKEVFLNKNVIHSTCKVPERIISSTIFFKICHVDHEIP